MKKKRVTITHQLFNSSLIKFSQAGFSVITSILLARSLGAESFGIYSFAFAAIALVGTLTHGGIPTLITREVAKFKSKKMSNEILGAIKFGAIYISTTSIFIVLLYIFFQILTKKIAETSQGFFFVGLFIIPAIGLNLLRGAALRGLQRITLGQIPELLSALVFLLLTAAFYPLLHGKPSLALGLYLAATVFALFVGSVLFHRELKVQRILGLRPLYENKIWLKSLLPLGLISIIQTANHQIDILSLGLLSTKSEVGVYRGATQLTTALALCLTITNSVIAPKISHLFHLNKITELQKDISKSIRLTLLLTIPISLMLIFAGKNILQILFGEEYGVASTALSILVLGQLVNTTLGPVGYILNMTGHERVTAIISAIALCINFSLNLILIPSYGVVGAAAASTTALTIWNAVLFYFAYRRTGIISLPYYKS